MYVCICNSITERQVDLTIGDGAHSARAVFQRLQCRPQCRMCVAEIKERIKHATGERPSSEDVHSKRRVAGCREAEMMAFSTHP